MRRGAVIAVAAVVLGLAGAAGGYYLFAGKDEPAPVGLSHPAPTTAAAAATGGATRGSADGTWQVVQGGDTFVGYRVQEQLAFLSAPNQAVGRSGAVQGTLQVAGQQITAADIKADLSQLASDQNRRDNAIRASGLESSTYPEATFVLSGPMQLSATPKVGTTVSGDAAGKLTIHGQTRDVTIPLQGRWDGATAQVAGNLKVNMPDYGITPPKLGPVQAIEDTATIELRLTFKKS
jgi:polyisoprenoid-binding protein YceI